MLILFAINFFYCIISKTNGGIMKSILVVDMQECFVSDKTKYLIKRINDYLAGNSFDNILFTKFVNDVDSPFSKILNWDNAMNQFEQEIIVDIPQNSNILTKNTYGLSLENIEFLKELNISEIEVCGIDVDACVLATAFDLFDNNIKPIILSNLCDTSSDKMTKDEILNIMLRQFGNENIR